MQTELLFLRNTLTYAHMRMFPRVHIWCPAFHFRPLFLTTGLIYLVMGVVLLLGVLKESKDERKSRKIVHVAT